MSQIPQYSFQWINRQEDLIALIPLLNQQEKLAVDTESNSLHAYREQVCLIQLSTPRQDYLLDPLVLEDLSPLEEVFASPKVEKVFHAAEYDLFCLYRDFHLRVNNLFDTMIAARVLGRPKVGLASLLEEEFGILQEKRHQRADWGKRPLSLALQDYAFQDTHFLIPLREKMEQALKTQGRWDLALEDFARACTPYHLRKTPAIRQVHEEVWRICGAGSLNGQQAAVLAELCQLRDKIACERNRPLFYIFSDKTLLAIAQRMPKDLDQLSCVFGMSRGQMQRYGTALLHAVQRGLERAPLDPPTPAALDKEFLHRLEKLRRWRQKRARHMGVSADVVLPRDLMLEIAQQNPHSPEELGEILREVPWRNAHFGSDIIKLLNT